MKVWVSTVTEAELRAVDCQLRRRNLCRELTELLFTDDELASSNATEAHATGVTLLKVHRLYAIRGTLTFFSLTLSLSCYVYTYMHS